jgi:hypothetical protein
MMRVTYILRFLGPGLPRGLGVLAPSIAEAPRFVPAFGAGALRLLPGAGGASDDGVLAPFMAAGVSAGVSAAVESAIMGAGEASGVEAGFDAGDGCAGASWGNCDSVLGESLRTAVRLFVGLVDIFANTLGPATWCRDGVGDGCRRWWWEEERGWQAQLCGRGNLVVSVI